MRCLLALLVVAFLGCTVNAFAPRVASRRAALSLASTETAVKAIPTIESPDFYWMFRLDRLAGKMGGALSYTPSNYPEAKDAKALYDAYYLDLTLQGKMDGFDWVSEKEVSEAEWQSIYKNICKWSASTVKANKPDMGNLPKSDFDLIKQFYPQLNFRELESPFSVEEVGANFPYYNMKAMMSAAMDGSLNVPGYSKDSVKSLEASEVKKDLAALKEKTMKRVETVYNQAMEFAKTPFPDDKARTHYKTLQSKLADFPQTPAAWDAFRANMDKQVDEMARLASKKDDHHHHHEEGEGDHVSPAQEFEQKYGRNLEEMQERFQAFKADPEGFLEASIIAKFGKNGLDVWKKSQEFSANMSVLSDADKKAAEKAFADFLKSA